MANTGIKIKPCYKCHERKPISEMEEIGIWVCKSCLNKLNKPKKKIKNKQNGTKEKKQSKKI
jgi:ribosomal protein L37AE/L43A